MGFLNLITLVLSSGTLMKLGLKFPEVKGDFSFTLYMTFVCGFIISVIGGVMVKNLELSKAKAFLIIYLVFSLNAFTQLLEALFFAQGIVSWGVAPAIFGQQFIMYLFLSAVIVLFYKYDKRICTNDKKPIRKFGGWLWRILVCSCSYVLFYFIFGSINAALFTKEYYSSQVSGLSLPTTIEILILEPIRAIILVLSVLPVIVYLKISKRKRMAMIGIVLFVIGGLLPMIQQLDNLPTVVVVTSIFEMFFQFFLTGVITTYILLYEKKGLESA